MNRQLFDMNESIFKKFSLMDMKGRGAYGIVWKV
jgi:hypothetical protein